MNWKTKELPNKGATRVIKRFLFFPLKINGNARWLEFAKIKQGFMVFENGQQVTYDGKDSPAIWVNWNFVEDK